MNPTDYPEAFADAVALADIHAKKSPGCYCVLLRLKPSVFADVLKGWFVATRNSYTRPDDDRWDPQTGGHILRVPGRRYRLAIELGS